MSRVRTRPTRDETREKLFEAAAEVFEEHGIGAASIEMIAAAAGLTRGAFYSNFDSKDDLIIAMLEDHVERSLQASPRAAGPPPRSGRLHRRPAHRRAQPSRSAGPCAAAAYGADPVRRPLRTPPARARQAPARKARPGHRSPRRRQRRRSGLGERHGAGPGGWLPPPSPDRSGARRRPTASSAPSANCRNWSRPDGCSCGGRQFEARRNPSAPLAFLI